MKAIDTKNFSDYAYCPLDETHLRGKDEKVQFVAVITSKAVVAPEGKKLTWSVADKSGVVCFSLHSSRVPRISVTDIG